MLPLLAASATLAASQSCPAVTVAALQATHVTAPYYATWNIDSSRDREFFDFDWADPQVRWKGCIGTHTFSLLTPPPQFRYLATAIGGARIRFGGTGNDALYYGVGTAPPCGPTVPAFYECLNSSTWSDLAELSTAVSSPMIVGLNIHPANASSPPSGPWDATNARALLTFAQERGDPIWALELGNEQNDNMDAAQQAGALRVLSSVLDDVYGSSAQRPLLVGPDTHSFTDKLPLPATFKYLADFAQAAGPFLAAITHHEYIEVAYDNVLNETFLDQSRVIAERTVATIKAVNATLPVWAGEIGPHNGGTTPLPNCADNRICGKFGSAIWYADSMAAKARAGYAAYCRQDVIGAWYSIINSTALTPSADFFLLTLWKQIVGTTVLSVAKSPVTGVRSYAHCARTSGFAVLILINIGSSSACVGLPSIAASGASRTEWSFTAGDTQLGVESATVALNGSVLALANGILPVLAGVVVPSTTPITLAPQSVTFVQLSVNDGGAACR